MLLVNPAANIPIVQVSVTSDESASSHLLMGRALARLRDSNVAIIGSGFASFHNLRIMRSIMSGTSNDPKFPERNAEWNCAVTAAMTETDGKKREDQLSQWRSWANAYEMHPRGGAEHFLPLLVAAGAGEGAAKSYTDEFLGLDMYSYYWD